MVSLANSFTDLFIESHLMIVQPENHLEAFVQAGSDRIIIHQESSIHLHRTLGKIRELGISPGVAINPATPIVMIEEVLELVDLVLVMTVNPGWGGQRFLTSCLNKIESIAELIQRKNLSTLIEVDGGIYELTVQRCVEAGASLLVAGSAIFEGNDPATKFTKLQSIALEGK
jgi:ribulose-phosphate 3-epimerase